MVDFNFGDGLRKVFLAGVGALATTVEKSQEIVDDLVKKGELTVEQGKALNEELKHKASSVSSDTEASILRGRMRVMTPEEREAYAAKVSQIKDDLNAEPVEVEAEPVEEAEDVEPEAADEPKDDAE